MENLETKQLLAILDKQIDQLITNMDMAQKILGDMVENTKKYNSGLLPEVSEEDMESAEVELEKDYLADKKLEESI